jgi:hypothetical protein
MQTRELIAKLEATQDQADDLTRRLIEDLKEHADATEAVGRLETLRIDQRGAAIAIALEAQIALIDMRRRAVCRKLFSFREAV